MGAAQSKKGKKKNDKKQKRESEDEQKKDLIKEPKNDEKNEVILEHKSIPAEIANKVTKAVCKITIETDKGIIHGTGFFLSYSDTKKYLMTCYQIINPTLENNKIELEIYNQKIIQLKFDNRFTKYMEEPEDIAIIEIEESDEIYNDVEYLNYDKNITNGGYSIYKDADIFSVEYLGGDFKIFSTGKIKDIYMI